MKLLLVGSTNSQGHFYNPWLWLYLCWAGLELSDHVEAKCKDISFKAEDTPLPEILTQIDAEYTFSLIHECEATTFFLNS